MIMNDTNSSHIQLTLQTKKQAQTNLVFLSEHQVQTTRGNISHKSRPQVTGGSIRHKGEDLKTKVNADILNITNPFIYFALKNR